MIQFYIEDIANLSQLPETESGHCVRVLRMTEGDVIVCVDGRGNRYRCRITFAHPKHCGIEILESQYVKPHWDAEITLCFAPTKHTDRIEWMAEKCTEMGIDRFIPVECTHSERRVFKTERLNKILISAMKQSLKTILPELNELTPIEKVLTDLRTADNKPFDGQKFICYCSDTVARKEFVAEYKPGQDVAILIGPEGDFSPQEVDTAINNGWIPVTLGESRLRTETAGMVAIANIHCINQLSKSKG